MSEYYVCVYIDPRNLEEFYYGKGRGSRKDSHLWDEAVSEKTARIKTIRKDGLEPIIRVIASQLTQDEALLIEATLIWKLGKYTTNLASGHFAGRFRPHDTLHFEMSGFDFQRGIYYYNVGEGHNRNWDDYRQFGFISAGQGKRWRDAIVKFQPGDVVAAYLKGRGFVGIGTIRQAAQPIRKVEIGKERLLDLPLKCQNMGENAGDLEKSEYVALVDWVACVPRIEAKWMQNSGLYSTTHVRASLDGQPKTVAFLDEQFKVNVRDLVK